KWDTDNLVSFDGIAFSHPYAMVRVPGERKEDPPRTMLLVEDGKMGALPRVARLVDERANGRAVHVTGTILERDGCWMLELAEGEEGMRAKGGKEKAFLPPLQRSVTEVFAEHATLKGEIIDPKCYLGAMKPGGGKTHKACAMLCISGGVPPMLVTRDTHKRETFHLLTSADGGVANEQVLPYVGDQVELSGQLEERGDLLIVKVGEEGIRRR